MTRITCQALHTPDGFTFIWSEGTASFEPYTLQGNEAIRLRAAAKAAWDALHAFTAAENASSAAFNLAQAGYELFLCIFQGDKGRAIADWLASRREDIDAQLQVAATSVTEVPWTVVFDTPPQEAAFRAGQTEIWQPFWGCRYALATTRRVKSLLFQPRVLLVIDPVLRSAMPEDQRPRLTDFVEAKKIPVAESKQALLEELRSQPPEVLYVFCRTDGKKLVIADESLSPTEIADVLEDDEDVAPLVILNTASPSASGGSVLPVVEQLKPAVATTSVLSAASASELGLALLEGFVFGGQPLGHFLQSQRRTSPQAGFAVSAFCSPITRIAWTEEAADQAETDLPPSIPLPEFPFRPLMSYDREDRALLAGREADVERFSQVLDEPESRIVLLHGPSGCGKASFLRAGVIPFLEDDCVGYLALRDRSDEEPAGNEKDYAALAIRPGPDLTGRLAQALVAFCARPFSYSTPTGEVIAIDLPEILRASVQDVGRQTTAIRESTASPHPVPPMMPPAEVGIAEVYDALEQDEAALGRLLFEISARLPFELVIAIEQAEELVTQARGASRRASRQGALAMLAAAAALYPRCKFILSLRTDFFGQLYDKLPPMPGGALKEYLLPPLRPEQLSLALLLPTAGEPIRYAAEVPLQKYGFQFEEGLAEQIATDVHAVARRRQDSAVSLLQAIATELFQFVKQRHDTVIRASDLTRIGGVEACFARFIDQRIKSLPIPYASQRGLRELFPLLYTRQSDGTVYRDLVPAREVSEAWRGSTPIQEVVGHASDDAARILEVNQFMVAGKQSLYVGLSQDSLARLAVEWDEDKNRRAYGRSRVADLLWIAIPLTLLLMVVTWWVTRRVWAAPEVSRDPRKEAEQIEEAVQSELSVLRLPLYVGQVHQARAALNAGNILRMRQLLLAQQGGREDDPRGFEWYYLWRQANRHRHTLVGHLGALTSVTMVPGGQWIASSSHDGTVKLWGTKSGQIKVTLQASGPVHSVALSADGKTVAGGAADGSISIWPVKDFKDYEIIDKAEKILKGHKGPVLALVFSPDGQMILSGGEDQNVLLWDIAKRETRQAFKNHTAAVRTVAFAPSGKAVASGGADQQLIIWGIDGKSLHSIKADIGEVNSLAFSPNGKLVATGGARRNLDLETGLVRFWDVESGKPSGPTLRHGSAVLGLAFLEDKTLATAGKDSALRIWDVEKGTQNGVLHGHLGAIRAIAASGDGKTIATASLDNTVKLWDTATALETNVIQAHKGGVDALALLFGDRFAVSGGADGVVRFWDLPNGNLVHSLPAQSGHTFALAAHAEGKTQLLATATWNDKDEGEIRVWELQTDNVKIASKELHVLKGHKKAITSLVFSLEGKLLASGSLDGSIILWDSTTGKERGTLTGHDGAVRCVAFALTGDYLISGGDDRKIRLWTIKGNREVPIFSLQMDKEGKHVKDIPFPLEGHLGPVTSLIYLPMNILSTSRDGTIKLWSLEEGTEVATTRAHAQGVLSMTPGGRVLVTSGADNAVRLWEVGQGLERFAFTDHTGPVRAVAATRDRTLILSGSTDGTIRLWRAAPERRKE